MRQLYPTAAMIDPIEAYEPGAGPYLRANMVSSLDGAAVIDGAVNTLTTPADQEILATLRAQADVVLVGSGTVRAEGYGPITIPTEYTALIERYGDQPERRLAIVTNSGRLDPDSPALTGRDPMVLMPASATPDPQLKDHAEIIIAGDNELDLSAAVAALRERGLGRILSEGGPRILGRLLAADLVDELCLTTSPQTVLGEGSRLAVDSVTHGQPFTLSHLLEADDFLFARWTRRNDL